MNLSATRILAATVGTVALVVTLGATAIAKPVQAPAGFVKVSDALKNPAMAWVPGLGTLYVDPKTLPAGPFFGYDKGGKLVNVSYMLPSKDLSAHKSWDNAGQAAKGLKIDHTDIYTSVAHPGVMEEHLHVVNWLIPVSEEAALGTYGGMMH
jgi:hypothetical protein